MQTWLDLQPTLKLCNLAVTLVSRVINWDNSPGLNLPTGNLIFDQLNTVSSIYNM
ncbi:hypothetical protein NSP_1290 [Nodularia spumigena CCY9414]|nr:hypothetical protein NSP_1290 [Nodularia spumigena CCY9414]